MSLKDQGGWCMLRVNDHPDAGVGGDDVGRDAGVHREQPQAAIRSRGSGRTLWSGGARTKEPALQQVEKERTWCGAAIPDPGERIKPSPDDTSDWAVGRGTAGTFEAGGTATLSDALHA